MQNVTYLMQVGSGNTARIFSCRTFDCSGPCFRCALLSLDYLHSDIVALSGKLGLFVFAHIRCFMNTQTHRRFKSVTDHFKQL